MVGNVHTNTIEGFWSLLKRGIGGVYRSVSEKHLQSYMNEYAFRYNCRGGTQVMFEAGAERTKRVRLSTRLAGEGQRDEGAMMGSVSYDHPSVTRPLYSFAEADRIARVTPGTSRRWLKGYRFWYGEERRTMPPVTPGRGEQDAVSFVGLMEVAAVSKLWQKNFSYKRIRQINSYCRVQLKVQRPLVTERFKIVGEDIFLAADFGVLLNVGREAGALAWREVLEPFLEDVEYENQIARRWWPLGKDRSVMVDPAYGFGLPVIEGKGIRTEILVERREAGDSIEEITYDFGVTPDQIEDALVWEKPDDAVA